MLVLGGERGAKGQMAGRGTTDVNLRQVPKGSLVGASAVETVQLGQGQVGSCLRGGREVSGR